MKRQRIALSIKSRCPFVSYKGDNTLWLQCIGSKFCKVVCISLILDQFLTFFRWPRPKDGKILYKLAKNAEKSLEMSIKRLKIT